MLSTAGRDSFFFCPPPHPLPRSLSLPVRYCTTTSQARKKSSEWAHLFSGLRGLSTDAGAQGPTTTDRDAKPVSCCWQWYRSLLWVIAVVGKMGADQSHSVTLGWSNHWDGGKVWGGDKWDMISASSQSVLKVPLCKACNVTSNLSARAAAAANGTRVRLRSRVCLCGCLCERWAVSDLILFCKDQIYCSWEKNRQKLIRERYYKA